RTARYRSTSSVGESERPPQPPIAPNTRQLTTSTFTHHSKRHVNMDRVSSSRQREDAEIPDTSSTEAPSEDAAQSAIPEVSLCPPDSDGTEPQIHPLKIEEAIPNTNPLKLHNRQESKASGYQQQPHKNCTCCGHPQSSQMCAAHQEDCSASPSKTLYSCSSSHLPSCHSKMQCHWHQESHVGRNYKPVQHQMVTIRNDSFHKIPRSYAQIIVEYPKTVLISSALLLFVCSLAGFLIGPLPDFSDPLLQNTGPGKLLSPVPWELTDRTTPGYFNAPLNFKHDQRIDYNEQNFFCNAPGESYARLVFRSGNSASLWSPKAIYSMCQMEQTQIRAGKQFSKLCQVRSEAYGSMVKNECCPSWSLGNYLAVLNNISSCFSLTAQHVSESLDLLRFCAPYYHKRSLVASCVERSEIGRCASVPLRCKQSTIFQILHYLVDKDFLGPQTVEYKVPSLKYSIVFLPVEKGDPLINFYLDNLEGNVVANSTTTITGMDLGIKQKLFKYYLARDSAYPVLAALALLFTMGLYLKSIFIPVMSLLAVMLSLSTSYFLYKVAFRLTFFPLLNLTSVLILLGTSLNQALTFVEFWKLQLNNNPPSVAEKRMKRVLQEIGYLILGSGLTSSITFYSGYISSISAVRCYAVFLGSASLINTLFALVWLPCSLVLQERFAVQSSNSVAKAPWKPCCSKKADFWETSSRKRCLFTMRQKLRILGRGLSDTSNLLFLKILPCGVVKFRYIWICWFGVLAAGGTYIACVDPGMKLPTSGSRTAQLFRSSHPFERYDAEYRHQFMFERMKEGEDDLMTLTIIWGIIPQEHDHFDTKSNQSLAFDPSFNMSSPQAQMWLRDLCANIQNQSFYSPISADQNKAEDSICLVERMIQWVSIRRCSESDNALRFCCNDIPFPYPPPVFELCLKMMVAEQHTEGHLSSAGGLKFDSEGQIAALVVIFKTVQMYTFNYSRMSKFYQEIFAWFNKEISSAPVGLKNGWFVSQLSLYDLQQCLSSETLKVAGFSVALSFALFLLTTWNIPLSLYVSIAVGGSVFATIGLLVLLEWQLNGVEALFISATAGLSVDFVANYCISYSLAPHSDRLGKVAHSIKRMGCPVAAGAGAYFCVGIVMLPATALLFRKLGIFLLLVKCVACGFATFFFQSLCCFFGPLGNCGRISLPCVSKQTIEKMHVSCSVMDSGITNPEANGTFECGTDSQAQKCFTKEREGFLCTNQHHKRQQPHAGREPEQYELQPLACQLSDSFENSTCTSKLSNRPSVLSDDIQFCGLGPRNDYDRISLEADTTETCNRHLRDGSSSPALHTSSPCKGTLMHPAVASSPDGFKEGVLCKNCQRRSVGGLQIWNASLSSSFSMEEIMITQTTDTVNVTSLSTDDSLQKQFVSCQSQSSMEGLEESIETSLSEVEPGSSASKAGITEEEFQPGHLNGKRDTLHLSLKETVYDLAPPGSGRARTAQSDIPVILPNSKPDMPDVWIKRDEGGS
ncbi:hypothetical protein DNTS_027405, partial [Danionella cerebrum]